MTTKLRELRQWVDWEWEQHDGKATKVPISPHEPRRAKSDDPTTWGTLTEARQSALVLGLTSSTVGIQRKESSML